MSESSGAAALLVRAGSRICALPLDRVVETMRPLPVTPLAGTPDFVTGAAVIRGSAVPVVDLDAFLGSGAPRPATRFVVVRAGDRTAALAVTAVIGLDRRAVAAGGPPMLSAACAGAVDSMGVLDDELLLVLRAGRVVPDDAWAALERAEART